MIPTSQVLEKQLFLPPILTIPDDDIWNQKFLVNLASKSLKHSSYLLRILYVHFTINGDNGCGTIHYDDRGVVRSIRVGQI